MRVRDNVPPFGHNLHAVTPLLAEVAWRVEWLKEKILGVEPVVTKESARASVSSFYYDNAKSLSLPGFSYRPLEETIRETAAQFREAAEDGFEAKGDAIGS